jgi:hypothetical protein
LWIANVDDGEDFYESLMVLPCWDADAQSRAEPDLQAPKICQKPLVKNQIRNNMQNS